MGGTGAAAQPRARPRTINHPRYGQRAGGRKKQTSSKSGVTQTATAKLMGSFRTAASFGVTRNTKQSYQAAKAAIDAVKAAKRSNKAARRVAQKIEQIAAEKERQQRAMSKASTEICGRYDGEIAVDYESGQIIGFYRRSGYQVIFHPIKRIIQ